MTLFVKLTHGNGEPVWINAAHVARIGPADLVPGGTDIGLAVAYTLPDDSSSLYTVRVTESPQRVVADLERALLVVPPR